jgi:hypothetical protein
MLNLQADGVLATDGLKMYLNAVADSFGEDIDYAMLVKVYGKDPTEEKRYSGQRVEAGGLCCEKPESDCGR